MRVGWFYSSRLSHWRHNNAHFLRSVGEVSTAAFKHTLVRGDIEERALVTTEPPP